MTLTDGLGEPPIDNRVLVALQDAGGSVLDVVSIAPLLEHGAVRIVGDDAPFRRGFVNEDDRCNLADAIHLLGFLFAAGREPGCLKAADANDDGKVNIADGIRLLAWLFIPGGDLLPAPSIDCGTDPTADALSCAVGTYDCGP